MDAFNDCIKILESMDHSLVPPEEWTKFKEILKPLTLERDDFLCQEGDPANKIAIIISGLFRAFYLSEGNEHTIVFRETGRIISPYNPYNKNRVSPFSLQALEESKVLYFSVRDFEKLLNNNSCWNMIAGQYYMGIYKEKEIREKALLTQDAETRYKDFLVEYPSLIERIPHYHIASYLGISNVTLSRIRSRLIQER